MKDLFIPYYLNNDGLKNLYQIALNRYTNIDLNAVKNTVSVQFSLPMAELTCGKIIQGNAAVTLNREITKANIDIDSQSLINIYVGLESMLNKNSAVTTITSSNINDLKTGDLVELDCVIDKGDASLETFMYSKTLLQYQHLQDSSMDNSELISWIDENIDNILNNNLIKISSEKLFSGDTVALIALCNDHSLVNINCYIGREITVLGEVTSHYTNSTHQTIGSETSEEAKLLKEILSDEKYKEVYDRLSEYLSKYAENDNTKYFEIAPLIIYL